MGEGIVCIVYKIKTLEKDELLAKEFQKVSLTFYENIKIQDKS